MVTLAYPSLDSVPCFQAFSLDETVKGLLASAEGCLVFPPVIVKPACSSLYGPVFHARYFAITHLTPNAHGHQCGVLEKNPHLKHAELAASCTYSI